MRWFFMTVCAMLLVACESGVDPNRGGRLSNVQIAPQNAQVEIESALQMEVTLVDSDGDAVDGRTVFWSSENAAIAEVSTSGLVTGKALGSTRIAASVEGVNALTTITVVPLGVSTVVVSPATKSLTVGEKTTLQATARDRNGGGVQGRPVSWSSDDVGVATVDATGAVTGVGAGSATITASIDGKTGEATVEVTPVAVASVTISPTSASLTVGGTRQFTATARDAGANTLTGRGVTWASSNPTVVSVSPAGLATALSTGSATITATVEGKTAEATVTVSAVPVASVAISPTSASLTVGGTRQFTATALDADANTLTGRAVTWASSNPAVVSVDNAGLARALIPGSAKITATVEGKVAEATVTVTAVPVASASISPTSASLTVGGTRQFTATALDADGNPLTDRAVTWASSNPAIVSVSDAGLASALTTGAARITALVEGRTAEANVTVAAVPIETVEVSPSSAEIQVLATRQFTAILKAADGSVLTGRDITWSSDSPLTASVSATGLVVGLVPGEAKITASSEGKSATATVTVTLVAAPPEAAAVLMVSGNNQSGDNEERLDDPLVVRVVDAQARPVAGVEVVWTTNNGSLSRNVVLTNSNGYASVQWTLGRGNSQVTRLAWAEVDGLPRVEFRAYRDD